METGSLWLLSFRKKSISTPPFYPSQCGGEGGKLGFRAVRALIRLLLWVFYRRIDVVGMEHFPAEGGVIIAANHHNSIIDAMLVLAVSPRRPRQLANAPLFK